MKNGEKGEVRIGSPFFKRPRNLAGGGSGHGRELWHGETEENDIFSCACNIQFFFSLFGERIKLFFTCKIFWETKIYYRVMEMQSVIKE